MSCSESKCEATFHISCGIEHAVIDLISFQLMYRCS